MSDTRQLTRSCGHRPASVTYRSTRNQVHNEGNQVESAQTVYEDKVKKVRSVRAELKFILKAVTIRISTEQKIDIVL